MRLATQYYRPPFPAPHRWRQDLSEIRSSGMEAIELWAVWAWIEPTEGEFVFDDFDELMALATEVGLKVIITAVAETQPYWIHRYLPDACMVDHMGHRIVSSTLAYNPQGLMPGACTDHPRVRELLVRFLQTLGARYAGHANLLFWDCWNEIRVAVQSDGFYCYCAHTLSSYVAWLKARHGSLDVINAAWRRRFTDWRDIPAAKQPGRSWTESMEWQRFLQDRTCELVGLRANTLRQADPSHPIYAHSVILSAFMQQGESEWDYPESRGNDWQIVQHLDGFGASHFPGWFQPLPSEYGARLESTRSAAGSRPHWVCELQGGGSKNGIHVMAPVTAQQQQRWIWMAFGRGVEGICFWCWRDEVFGRESAGFGVTGDDGHAPERLAAIKHTNEILQAHRSLLCAYAPVKASVGVIFDSLNHQLEWAQYGKAACQSGNSVKAYLQCLERLNTPYDVIDAGHLRELESYRVLFLPWPMIVREELARALFKWIQSGGVLVAESELGAFNAYGFYTYPDERAFANSLGVRGRGRRPMPNDCAINLDLGDGVSCIQGANWLEPLVVPNGKPIATAAGECVGISSKVGTGEVLVIGTHAGVSYCNNRHPGFETFIRTVVARAGASPDVTCAASDGDVIQLHYGLSGDTLLLFVTNEGAEIELSLTLGGEMNRPVMSAIELLCGESVRVTNRNRAVEVQLRARAGGSHVIALEFASRAANA